MAMNPVQIDVRLNRMALKEATEEGERIAGEIVRTAREYAKELSPYLRGHNRSSITFDRDSKGWVMYTQSGYGAFLEIGTARMAARPYMLPGIQRAFQEAQGRGAAR